MIKVRHKRRIAGMLGLALFGLLLAACGPATTGLGAGGGSTILPSVTGNLLKDATPRGAGDCKPRVAASAPVPPPPAPTPIVPRGEKSYTNSRGAYTITYPANWVVSDATTPDGQFLILNYDPATYAPSGGDIAPPPYNAIRIDVLDNPTRLTPEAYNTANPPFSNSQIGVLACWETLSKTEVNGQDAFALVIWSAYRAGNEGGKSMLYRPGIRYYIATGDRLLRVDEVYSEGAKPSAALRQVIDSMRIGA